MIRKILTRLLKFFVKLGFLGRVVSFRYSGQAVSLNKIYAQGHWTERQEYKNKYKTIFNSILNKTKGKLKIKKFYLLIFYNSRHDVDNVIGMEKIFTDSMKGKIIPNDGKKFYRGLMVFPDKNLPMNTFEFVLIEILKDEL